MTEHTTTLKRTLGSFRLWGIAVGLVISGEYFGWSYGWSQAGTMGFMVVALAVAAMYCAFIFSFTELTTAIPHAGGPFAYAYRAFGPTGGFIAGFATLIEFVFAPPAIAMAIGAYLNVQFPALDPKWVACGAYVIFMTLNILGVGIAATFELIVTLLAIFELLVFMGVVAPGFSWSHFTTNGWAGADSFSGMPLTACIVTMSVFGAIVMYITSMAALFKLRRSEPKLIRPFRAPLYPLAPAFALGMAVLCLVAMVWYNLLLALIFAAMMLGGYLWFRKTAAARERAPVDPQLRTVS
ncbi:TPA: amino acid permease [Klebsiella pneumoniae]